MMYHFEDVAHGYDVQADVIVVGTGAGGAVAAANFAAAGLKTVVIEAGPQLKTSDMTREAPSFLAKYFWDGGLRMIMGTTPVPCMQGRAVGGSTISNSAIMLKIPDWVRQEWIEKDGLTALKAEAFDRCFERVFANTFTAKTPLDVQGPRNLSIRDALTAMGVTNGPLPRAVKDCKGCADCLVGCACGAKQSLDKSYIPQAIRDGADVYTCSEVDRLIFEGDQVVGVTGNVINIDGWKRVARFTVRAPRVVLAAGAMHTPNLLQLSGVKHRGAVGGTLAAHLSSGVLGFMEKPMHPWIGATQGWGAMSNDIKGMKFESLWADPSVILVKWGGYGQELLRRLPDVNHLTIGAVVYRGRCKGTVRPRFNGSPNMKLWIPKDEAQVVFRGMKVLADGLFKVGARSVHVGKLPGVNGDLTDPSQTEMLLSKSLTGRNLTMTGNHVFCTARMTADERTPVAPDGRVRGVKGVWCVDASVFPSPSAVNPQATIMAVSDLLTRRIAELPA